MKQIKIKKGVDKSVLKTFMEVIHNQIIEGSITVTCKEPLINVTTIFMENAEAGSHMFSEVEKKGSVTIKFDIIDSGLIIKK